MNGCLSETDFPIERLQSLMLKSAELVDMFGEELRPFLDYWKAHYLAARDRTSAVDEVRALIGGGV